MRSVFATLLIATTLLLPSAILAQDEAPVLEPDPAVADQLPVDTFYRGRVIEVIEDGTRSLDGYAQPYQVLRIRLEHGPLANQDVTVEHGERFSIQETQKVRRGERVLIGETTRVDGSTFLYVADRMRTRPLLTLASLFLVLIVAVAGLSGLRSLLGLAFTVLVLGWFLLPRIVGGADPLITSFTAAVAIAVVSLYLAHGLRRRTTVAVLATLATLGIGTGLAVLFASVAHLSGAGSEDAFSLQIGQLAGLDLRGLLLGSILIGALGVLDDVTTAQAATIEELKRANPALTPRELYRRGLSVGREHVTSLVNTLALAYVGAALPLFLVAAVNQTYPAWVFVNSEFFAEEVLRTLVGSIALILAVPLTSALAAYAFRDGAEAERKHADHHH